MKIDDIDAFVEVIRCQSISHAAESLQLTQPAITRRVQNFEQALGVELFDRNTKPLKPTLIGTRVYEQCRSILREMDALRELVATDAPPTGLLRLGVPQTIGDVVLPDALHGPLDVAVRCMHPREAGELSTASGWHVSLRLLVARNPKPVYDMAPAEKLGAARLWRELGNACYGAKDWERALNRYVLAAAAVAAAAACATTAPPAGVFVGGCARRPFALGFRRRGGGPAWPRRAAARGGVGGVYPLSHEFSSGSPRRCVCRIYGAAQSGACELSDPGYVAPDIRSTAKRGSGARRGARRVRDCRHGSDHPRDYCHVDRGDDVVPRNRAAGPRVCRRDLLANGRGVGWL